MREIILFILLIFFVLVISGCSSPKEPETQEQVVEPVVEKKGDEKGASIGGDNAQITIKNGKFVPAEIRVKLGTTVTWTNEDTVPRWPASAVHPSHAAYPESGGCIGSTFDACKKLLLGEKYSFIFNQKGTWEYHDHLAASIKGKIIVD